MECSGSKKTKEELVAERRRAKNKERKKRQKQKLRDAKARQRTNSDGSLISKLLLTNQASQRGTSRRIAEAQHSTKRGLVGPLLPGHLVEHAGTSRRIAEAQHSTKRSLVGPLLPGHLVERADERHPSSQTKLKRKLETKPDVEDDSRQRKKRKPGTPIKEPVVQVKDPRYELQPEKKSNPENIQQLIKSVPEYLVLQKQKQNKKFLYGSNYGNNIPKSVYRKLKGHSGAVNAVRWSNPHGHLLASASYDKTCKIWDVRRGGPCLFTIDAHSGAIRDCQFNWDGSQILTASFDSSAILTDVVTGKSIQKFLHKQYVTTLEFAPGDQSLFISGGFNSGIFCWDVRTNKIAREYKGAFGQVMDLMFLPDANSFVSTVDISSAKRPDQGIQVWDFRAAAVISNQVYTEPYTCSCLRLNPNGLYFAGQTDDHCVLFSTNPPYKRKKKRKYVGHKCSAFSIEFSYSKDGTILATGASDGRIFFYADRSCNIIKTFEVDKYQAVMDTAYHPLISNMLAVCCWDGAVKVLK